MFLYIKIKKSALNVKCLIICLIFLFPAYSAQTKKINILVYPFKYAGPEENSWIARGLSDTILSDLMKIKNFNVFPESERIQALQEIQLGQTGIVVEKNIVQVGSLLGAHVIFSGTVQVSGDQVRITARLVDVETARLLKALKTDGVIKDIFKLQDDLVVSLMKESSAIKEAHLPAFVYTPEEKEAVRNKSHWDLDTYKWYYTGLGLKESNPGKALEYFQKAAAKQPDYLDALMEASESASRISTKANQGGTGGGAGEKNLAEQYREKANDLVTRKKICDYKYAYRLIIQGIKWGKQHKIAPSRKKLFEAKKILECLGMENTSSYAALMQNLGNTYFMTSKRRTSLKYYNRAQAIYLNLNLKNSLGNANTLNNIANVHSDQGKYAKGIEIYSAAHQIYNKLRERNPLVYDSTYQNIGTCHRMMSDYSMALKYYKQALAMIQKLDLEDTYHHAAMMINFAAYHEEQSNKKEAARMYRKAYYIYEELGYVGPLKKLARDRARLNER